MGDRAAATDHRKALRRGLSPSIWLLSIPRSRAIASSRCAIAPKLGEIDLIARKRNLAIFVEMKGRREEMSAIDGVLPMAQNRIRAACDLWLARQRDYAVLSQRYDIVAVLPGRPPGHFPNAF